MKEVLSYSIIMQVQLLQNNNVSTSTVLPKFGLLLQLKALLMLPLTPALKLPQLLLVGFILPLLKSNTTTTPTTATIWQVSLMLLLIHHLSGIYFYYTTHYSNNSTAPLLLLR